MRKCDIIIPVYNAYDCLAECIDSILEYTNFGDNHLILIDDCSPDKKVLLLLRKYARKNKDKITLIRNEKNLGFVATVNKGMSYSKNDVLLLNSDTVVTSGWLDLMKKCAEKDKMIATVTPLSNNKTPLRLPESFRKRGFPEGYTLEKMAHLIKKYSMHVYPEIMSAHGFCMYIKREVLDKFGFFDVETFGKGYGEENDFCFHCLRYGYKHVLCDDAYVFHKGTQSFLEKKQFHNEELEKKHPQIMRKVGLWYLKQDYKKIIDNIVLAISAEEKRVNILVIPYKKKMQDVENVVKSLVSDYNFHVLEKGDYCYKIHSYFRDADLITAIYQMPLVCWGDETDSREYKEMLSVTKKIYGITVVEEGSDIKEERIKQDCKKVGKKEKIEYKSVQEKMLEYDLVRNIMTGTVIKEEEEKIRGAEDMELLEKKWRENLNIPQRIYLKIRYILFGR